MFEMLPLLSAVPLTQPVMIPLLGGLLCLVVTGLFIYTLIMAITKKSKGWVIGVCVTTVLGLALLGGVVAGVVKSVRSQMAKSQELKRVAGKSGRISLQVPGNWTNLPELHSEADLTFGNKFKEHYLIVISEPTEDTGMDLEEYSDVVTNHQVEASEGKATKAVKLSLNGLPAIRREITGDIRGAKIVWFRADVASRDHFHQVLGWTMVSKRAEYGKIFEEVLGSLQCSDGPPVEEPKEDLVPAKNVRSRALPIFTSVLNVEEARIVDTAKLKELGGDDLDSVELVMALEEEFDLTIADEVAESWDEIGPMLAWLEANAKDLANLPVAPPEFLAHPALSPLFGGGSEPEFGAGTAFVCEVEGWDSRLLLTAQHLFGTAGGLPQDLAWNEVPKRFPQATVHSPTEKVATLVSTKCLAIRNARGMDDKGLDYDLAAYEVPTLPEFPALKLAAKAPEVGQVVFLGSQVQGWCPAKVNKSEGSLLRYRFYKKSVILPGTSGAPVVNEQGEVVAINLGGIQGKQLIGLGIPVTSIRARLDSTK